MSKETRVDRGRRRIGEWLGPLLCLLLLGGLTADRRLYHMPVGDPGPYHARIRAAVQAIPANLDGWEGIDETVPPSAVELLRPNVILGRRYVNPRTGQWAKLMIVHCRDARDMGGHYPPVCYPSNGWTPDPGGTRERTWTIGGLRIPGMEYAFHTGGFPRTSSIIVYNFILRPDGLIERDIRGLVEAAYDPRKKLFGAGQVQVLFEASTPEASREKIFEILIRGCLPAIREILSGVTQ